MPPQPVAAAAIARLCFETLMEHGEDAKRAVELHIVTPAVEKVIEANVLLSGLGFESAGVATARRATPDDAHARASGRAAGR